MVKSESTASTVGTGSLLRAARSGNIEKLLHLLDDEGVSIASVNSSGLNCLHLAAKEGHLTVVQEVIKRNVNVNSPTKKGNTALHIAALAGKSDIVIALLQNNADPNLIAQNAFTPLYMAAQEGHDDIVDLLLKAGANQSIATKDGFTPLAVALQERRSKVVSLLLDNDVKGRVKLPALHIAARKDDVKAAALLLQNENSAEVSSKWIVNRTTESGFTALHIAAHYGNVGVASLLLNRGAAHNTAARNGITPLHVASKRGHTRFCAMLVGRNADLNAQTKDGLIPLHCAARSGHKPVVELLLDKMKTKEIARTKNGLSALHMAVQGGHVNVIHLLINQNYSVDDTTSDYLTSLHIASHCGHEKVAQLLLSRRAKVDAQAMNGFTPLHVACKKNQIRMVVLLLNRKANTEAITESGLTPLHVACFMGHSEIIRILLEKGAHLNTMNNRGETALHMSVRSGRVTTVKYLLAHGALPDLRKKESQTCLHLAARLNKLEIVKVLLEHQASIDELMENGYSPLHVACQEGHVEICELLIDSGASVSLKNKNGFTALHLSSKYGRLAVANLLLRKSASPDAVGKDDLTPLHVASHYDNQNVALLLLKNGASPQTRAKNAYTPLHIAAKKDQIDIAISLMEYGASTGCKTRMGTTPLHLAAQAGHIDMCSLLAAKEANVNDTAKFNLTPMHLAAEEDRTPVIKLLFDNGALLDPLSKSGYTPLHVASHRGNYKTVECLLLLGARVNAKTKTGYAPLHLAAQQGHTQVVNLLLQNGALPNELTNNGHTALSLANQFGYITVVDTLTTVTTEITETQMEKQPLDIPETLTEEFMSEASDEDDDAVVGGDENLTGKELEELGDDSIMSTTAGVLMSQTDRKADTENSVDIKRLSWTSSVGEVGESDNCSMKNKKTSGFLVSFMVDARGGSMRGSRYPNLRIYVPPKSCSAPTRITCRLARSKLSQPDSFHTSTELPLCEDEGQSSRVLDFSGVGKTFLHRRHTPVRILLNEGQQLVAKVMQLGPKSYKLRRPIAIEIPHFASLRGSEREIVVIRSDDGELWREHKQVCSDSDFLKHSGSSDLETSDELARRRVVRVLTKDLPKYFALYSRTKEDFCFVSPDGGKLKSQMVEHVSATFPAKALTKEIRVGIQACPISSDLCKRAVGNAAKAGPIVTVEPRRRKFHKPIVLGIPYPEGASMKSFLSTSEEPSLRLLCSISGGTDPAYWEDITESNPLSFYEEYASFTTTVSAKFWLVNCLRSVDSVSIAEKIYEEAMHVPYMARFVVLAKTSNSLETNFRVFCITDEKCERTLENQEHFVEIARSRDIEVLKGSSIFLECSGNLALTRQTQPSCKFIPFEDNRLHFSIKVRDMMQKPSGRLSFYRDERGVKIHGARKPICNLNVTLPNTVEDNESTEMVEEEDCTLNISHAKQQYHLVYPESVSTVEQDIADGGLSPVDVAEVMGKLIAVQQILDPKPVDSAECGSLDLPKLPSCSASFNESSQLIAEMKCSLNEVKSLLETQKLYHKDDLEPKTSKGKETTHTESISQNYKSVHFSTITSGRTSVVDAIETRTNIEVDKIKATKVHNDDSLIGDGMQPIMSIDTHDTSGVELVGGEPLDVVTPDCNSSHSSPAQQSDVEKDFITWCQQSVKLSDEILEKSGLEGSYHKQKNNGNLLAKENLAGFLSKNLDRCIEVPKKQDGIQLTALRIEEFIRDDIPMNTRQKNFGHVEPLANFLVEDLHSNEGESCNPQSAKAERSKALMKDFNKNVRFNKNVPITVFDERSSHGHHTIHVRSTKMSPTLENIASKLSVGDRVKAFENVRKDADFVSKQNKEISSLESEMIYQRDALRAINVGRKHTLHQSATADPTECKAHSAINVVKKHTLYQSAVSDPTEIKETIPQHHGECLAKKSSSPAGPGMDRTDITSLNTSSSSNLSPTVDTSSHSSVHRLLMEFENHAVSGTVSDHFIPKCADDTNSVQSKSNVFNKVYQLMHSLEERNNSSLQKGVEEVYHTQHKINPTLAQDSGPARQDPGTYWPKDDIAAETGSNFADTNFHVVSESLYSGKESAQETQDSERLNDLQRNNQSSPIKDLDDNITSSRVSQFTNHDESVKTCASIEDSCNTTISATNFMFRSHLTLSPGCTEVQLPLEYDLQSHSQDASSTELLPRYHGSGSNACLRDNSDTITSTQCQLDDAIEKVSIHSHIDDLGNQDGITERDDIDDNEKISEKILQKYSNLDCFTNTVCNQHPEENVVKKRDLNKLSPELYQVSVSSDIDEATTAETAQSEQQVPQHLSEPPLDTDVCAAAHSNVYGQVAQGKTIFSGNEVIANLSSKFDDVHTSLDCSQQTSIETARGSVLLEQQTSARVSTSKLDVLALDECSKQSTENISRVNELELCYERHKKRERLSISECTSKDMAVESVLIEHKLSEEIKAIPDDHESLSIDESTSKDMAVESAVIEHQISEEVKVIPDDHESLSIDESTSKEIVVESPVIEHQISQEVKVIPHDHESLSIDESTSKDMAVENDVIEHQISEEVKVIPHDHESLSIDESTSKDMAVESAVIEHQISEEIKAIPDDHESLSIDESTSKDMAVESAVIEHQISEEIKAIPDDHESLSIDESTSKDMAVESAVIEHQLSEEIKVIPDDLESLSIDESTSKDMAVKSAVIEYQLSEEIKAIPDDHESLSIDESTSKDMAVESAVIEHQLSEEIKVIPDDLESLSIDESTSKDMAVKSAVIEYQLSAEIKAIPDDHESLSIDESTSKDMAVESAVIEHQLSEEIKVIPDDLESLSIDESTSKDMAVKSAVIEYQLSEEIKVIPEDHESLSINECTSKDMAVENAVIEHQLSEEIKVIPEDDESLSINECTSKDMAVENNLIEQQISQEVKVIPHDHESLSINECTSKDMAVENDVIEQQISQEVKVIPNDHESLSINESTNKDMAVESAVIEHQISEEIKAIPDDHESLSIDESTSKDMAVEIAVIEHQLSEEIKEMPIVRETLSMAVESAVIEHQLSEEIKGIPEDHGSLSIDESTSKDMAVESAVIEYQLSEEIKVIPEDHESLSINEFTSKDMAVETAMIEHQLSEEIKEMPIVHETLSMAVESGVIEHQLSEEIMSIPDDHESLSIDESTSKDMAVESAVIEHQLSEEIKEIPEHHGSLSIDECTSKDMVVETAVIEHQLSEDIKEMPIVHEPLSMAVESAVIEHQLSEEIKAITDDHESLSIDESTSKDMAVETAVIEHQLSEEIKEMPIVHETLSMAVKSTVIEYQLSEEIKAIPADHESLSIDESTSKDMAVESAVMEHQLPEEFKVIPEDPESLSINECTTKDMAVENNVIEHQLSEEIKEMPIVHETLSMAVESAVIEHQISEEIKAIPDDHGSLSIDESTSKDMAVESAVIEHNLSEEIKGIPGDHESLSIDECTSKDMAVESVVSEHNLSEEIEGIPDDHESLSIDECTSKEMAIESAVIEYQLSEEIKEMPIVHETLSMAVESAVIEHQISEEIKAIPDDHGSLSIDESTSKDMAVESAVIEHNLSEEIEGIPDDHESLSIDECTSKEMAIESAVIEYQLSEEIKEMPIVHETLSMAVESAVIEHQLSEEIKGIPDDHESLSIDESTSKDMAVESAVIEHNLSEEIKGIPGEHESLSIDECTSKDMEVESVVSEQKLSEEIKGIPDDHESLLIDECTSKEMAIESAVIEYQLSEEIKEMPIVHETLSMAVESAVIEHQLSGEIKGIPDDHESLSIDESTSKDMAVESAVIEHNLSEEIKGIPGDHESLSIDECTSKDMAVEHDVNEYQLSEEIEKMPDDHESLSIDECTSKNMAVESVVSEQKLSEEFKGIPDDQESLLIDECTSKDMTVESAVIEHPLSEEIEGIPDDHESLSIDECTSKEMAIESAVIEYQLSEEIKEMPIVHETLSMAVESAVIEHQLSEEIKGIPDDHESLSIDESTSKDMAVESAVVEHNLSEEIKGIPGDHESLSIDECTSKDMAVESVVSEQKLSEEIKGIPDDHESLLIDECTSKEMAIESAVIEYQLSEEIKEMPIVHETLSMAAVSAVIEHQLSEEIKGIPDDHESLSIDESTSKDMAVESAVIEHPLSEEIEGIPDDHESLSIDECTSKVMAIESAVIEYQLSEEIKEMPIVHETLSMAVESAVIEHQLSEEIKGIPDDHESLSIDESTSKDMAVESAVIEHNLSEEIKGIPGDHESLSIDECTSKDMAVEHDVNEYQLSEEIEKMPDDHESLSIDECTSKNMAVESVVSEQKLSEEFKGIPDDHESLLIDECTSKDMTVESFVDEHQLSEEILEIPDDHESLSIEECSSNDLALENVVIERRPFEEVCEISEAHLSLSICQSTSKHMAREAVLHEYRFSDEIHERPGAVKTYLSECQPCNDICEMSDIHGNLLIDEYVREKCDHHLSEEMPDDYGCLSNKECCPNNIAVGSSLIDECTSGQLLEGSFIGEHQLSDQMIVACGNVFVDEDTNKDMTDQYVVSEHELCKEYSDMPVAQQELSIDDDECTIKRPKDGAVLMAVGEYQCSDDACEGLGDGIKKIAMSKHQLPEQIRISHENVTVDENASKGMAAEGIVIEHQLYQEIPEGLEDETMEIFMSEQQFSEDGELKIVVSKHELGEEIWEKPVVDQHPSIRECSDKVVTVKTDEEIHEIPGARQCLSIDQCTNENVTIESVVCKDKHSENMLGSHDNVLVDVTDTNEDMSAEGVVSEYQYQPCREIREVPDAHERLLIDECTVGAVSVRSVDDEQELSEERREQTHGGDGNRAVYEWTTRDVATEGVISEHQDCTSEEMTVQNFIGEYQLTEQTHATHENVSIDELTNIDVPAEGVMSANQEYTNEEPSPEHMLYEQHLTEQTHAVHGSVSVDDSTNKDVVVVESAISEDQHPEQMLVVHGNEFVDECTDSNMTARYVMDEQQFSKEIREICDAYGSLLTDECTSEETSRKSVQQLSEKNVEMFDGLPLHECSIDDVAVEGVVREHQCSDEIHEMSDTHECLSIHECTTGDMAVEGVVDEQQLSVQIREQMQNGQVNACVDVAAVSLVSERQLSEEIREISDAHYQLSTVESPTEDAEVESVAGIRQIPGEIRELLSAHEYSSTDECTAKDVAVDVLIQRELSEDIREQMHDSHGNASVNVAADSVMIEHPLFEELCEISVAHEDLSTDECTTRDTAVEIVVSEQPISEEICEMSDNKERTSKTAISKHQPPYECVSTDEYTSEEVYVEGVQQISEIICAMSDAHEGLPVDECIVQDVAREHKLSKEIDERPDAHHTSSIDEFTEKENVKCKDPLSEQMFVSSENLSSDKDTNKGVAMADAMSQRQLSEEMPDAHKHTSIDECNIEDMTVRSLVGEQRLSENIHEQVYDGHGTSLIDEYTNKDITSKDVVSELQLYNKFCDNRDAHGRLSIDECTNESVAVGIVLGDPQLCQEIHESPDDHDIECINDDKSVEYVIGKHQLTELTHAAHENEPVDEFTNIYMAAGGVVSEQRLSGETSQMCDAHGHLLIGECCNEDVSESTISDHHIAEELHEQMFDADGSFLVDKCTHKDKAVESVFDEHHLSEGTPDIKETQGNVSIDEDTNADVAVEGVIGEHQLTEELHDDPQGLLIDMCPKNDVAAENGVSEHQFSEETCKPMLAALGSFELTNKDVAVESTMGEHQFPKEIHVMAEHHACLSFGECTNKEVAVESAVDEHQLSEEMHVRLTVDECTSEHVAVECAVDEDQLSEKIHTVPEPHACLSIDECTSMAMKSDVDEHQLSEETYARLSVDECTNERMAEESNVYEDQLLEQIQKAPEPHACLCTDKCTNKEVAVESPVDEHQLLEEIHVPLSVDKCTSGPVDVESAVDEDQLSEEMLAVVNPHARFPVDECTNEEVVGEHQYSDNIHEVTDAHTNLSIDECTDEYVAGTVLNGQKIVEEFSNALWQSIASLECSLVEDVRNVSDLNKEQVFGEFPMQSSKSVADEIKLSEQHQSAEDTLEYHQEFKGILSEYQGADETLKEMLDTEMCLKCQDADGVEDNNNRQQISDEGEFIAENKTSETVKVFAAEKILHTKTEIVSETAETIVTADVPKENLTDACQVDVASSSRHDNCEMPQMPDNTTVEVLLNMEEETTTMLALANQDEALCIEPILDMADVECPFADPTIDDMIVTNQGETPNDITLDALAHVSLSSQSHSSSDTCVRQVDCCDIVELDNNNDVEASDDAIQGNRIPSTSSNISESGSCDREQVSVSGIDTGNEDYDENIHISEFNDTEDYHIHTVFDDIHGDTTDVIHGQQSVSQNQSIAHIDDCKEDEKISPICGQAVVGKVPKCIQSVEARVENEFVLSKSPTSIPPSDSDGIKLCHIGDINKKARGPEPFAADDLTGETSQVKRSPNKVTKEDAFSTEGREYNMDSPASVVHQTGRVIASGEISQTAVVAINENANTEEVYCDDAEISGEPVVLCPSDPDVAISILSFESDPSLTKSKDEYEFLLHSDITAHSEFADIGASGHLSLSNRNVVDIVSIPEVCQSDVSQDTPESLRNETAGCYNEELKDRKMRSFDSNETLATFQQSNVIVHEASLSQSDESTVLAQNFAPSEDIEVATQSRSTKICPNTKAHSGERLYETDTLQYSCTGVNVDYTSDCNSYTRNSDVNNVVDSSLAKTMCDIDAKTSENKNEVQVDYSDSYDIIWSTVQRRASESSQISITSPADDNLTKQHDRSSFPVQVEHASIESAFAVAAHSMWRTNEIPSVVVTMAKPDVEDVEYQNSVVTNKNEAGGSVDAADVEIDSCYDILSDSLEENQHDQICDDEEFKPSYCEGTFTEDNCKNQIMPELKPIPNAHTAEQRDLEICVTEFQNEVFEGEDLDQYSNRSTVSSSDHGEFSLLHSTTRGGEIQPDDNCMQDDDLAIHGISWDNVLPLDIQTTEETRNLHLQSDCWKLDEKILGREIQLDDDRTEHDLIMSGVVRDAVLPSDTQTTEETCNLYLQSYCRKLDENSEYSATFQGLPESSNIVSGEVQNSVQNGKRTCPDHTLTKSYASCPTQENVDSPVNRDVVVTKDIAGDSIIDVAHSQECAESVSIIHSQDLDFGFDVEQIEEPLGERSQYLVSQPHLPSKSEEITFEMYNVSEYCHSSDKSQCVSGSVEDSTLMLECNAATNLTASPLLLHSSQTTIIAVGVEESDDSSLCTNDEIFETDVRDTVLENVPLEEHVISESSDEKENVAGGINYKLCDMADTSGLDCESVGDAVKVTEYSFEPELASIAVSEGYEGSFQTKVVKESQLYYSKAMLSDSCVVTSQQPVTELSLSCENSSRTVSLETTVHGAPIEQHDKSTTMQMIPHSQIHINLSGTKRIDTGITHSPQNLDESTDAVASALYSRGVSFVQNPSNAHTGFERAQYNSSHHSFDLKNNEFHNENQCISKSSVQATYNIPYQNLPVEVTSVVWSSAVTGCVLSDGNGICRNSNEIGRMSLTSSSLFAHNTDATQLNAVVPQNIETASQRDDLLIDNVEQSQLADQNMQTSSIVSDNTEIVVRSSINRHYQLVETVSSKESRDLLLGNSVSGVSSLPMIQTSTVKDDFTSRQGFLGTADIATCSCELQFLESPPADVSTVTHCKNFYTVKSSRSIVSCVERRTVLHAVSKENQSSLTSLDNEPSCSEVTSTISRDGTMTEHENAGISGNSVFNRDFDWSTSFRAIASELGLQWMELARELDISESTVWNIQKECDEDIGEKGFCLLTIWHEKSRDKCDCETVLRAVLIKIGREDLTKYLRSHISLLQSPQYKHDDSAFSDLAYDLGTPRGTPYHVSTPYPFKNDTTELQDYEKEPVPLCPSEHDEEDDPNKPHFVYPDDSLSNITSTGTNNDKSNDVESLPDESDYTHRLEQEVVRNLAESLKTEMNSYNEESYGDERVAAEDLQQMPKMSLRYVTTITRSYLMEVDDPNVVDIPEVMISVSDDENVEVVRHIVAEDVSDVTQ